MAEWWTYRPGDFLMFSPRVYWRLFELLNEAAWPLQPLLLAAGLAGAVALARGRQRLPVAAGVALAWHAGQGPPPGGWRRRVAVALALWAVLLHPLLAPLAGRPIAQAELAGLAPDPTALFTLAFLLTLPRARGAGWRALTTLAWAVPLAWCGFSAFMLATMASAQAGVPLLGAAAALLASRAGARDVQY